MPGSVSEIYAGGETKPLVDLSNESRVSTLKPDLLPLGEMISFRGEEKSRG